MHIRGHSCLPVFLLSSTLVVTIPFEGTRPSSKIHLFRLVNNEGRLGRSYHLHLHGEAVKKKNNNNNNTTLLLRVLDSECARNMFLRNVCTYIPVDTA